MSVNISICIYNKKTFIAILNHFTLIMRYIYLYVINYFYINVKPGTINQQKSNIIVFISAQTVTPCSKIHEQIYFQTRRLLTAFVGLRKWTFKRLPLITQSHSLCIAVISDFSFTLVLFPSLTDNLLRIFHVRIGCVSVELPHMFSSVLHG